MGRGPGRELVALEAGGRARGGRRSPAYVAHIDGDLGGYLRGYLFRLQEGRPARPGEGLPGL
ncbi:hypothetical protein ACGFX2_03045 [Streptomyces goshikiensis]|uniref:hypothetical protein n=1 Tax=Streptomyces goshikiensis TaxID=1942 RepID=UPI003721BBDA